MLSPVSRNETQGEGANVQGSSQVTRDLQVPSPLGASGWHPDIESVLQCNHIKGPQSTTAISNTVEDGGDALQLQDIEEKRLSAGGLNTNTVEHAGARFAAAESIERPSSIPDDLGENPSKTLDDLIRDKIIPARELTNTGNARFLPLDDLENIITPENIGRELTRIELTSNLDHTVSEVWKTQEWRGGKTSRRKLFAILCLSHKANAIEDFLEEKLFDSDLPFEFISSRQPLSKSGADILLFQKWKNNDRDSFVDYQRRFLAPYFKFDTAKITHYELHRGVVLPFTQLEAKDNDFLATNLSIVSRVEIHPAHHDYVSPHGKDEKVYFAVKQLQKIEPSDIAQAYNREVSAYKRLKTMREHAHIVALLATYSHQDRLHMIFPWADGNLYQFWNKSFPQDTDLGRGHDLARWMISQFIGLAEGLECIHTSVVPPAADDVQPESRDKTHGRHGDIKPENILWFRSATGNSPIQKLGNFKISDLGSTEFHGTHSQEVQANASGGFTETYKSPEFDMMKRVSPVSDIWSFGCVLLQFVVWYVRGWSGVEDFTKQRKVESNFTILGDQFFNFNERERTVEEKPCVPREFTRLREHTATSDFVLALLDLIQKQLLRTDVSERASCVEIVNELKKISTLCDKDIQYCTERKLTDAPINHAESAQKSRAEFSEEMMKEYIRNIDPKVRRQPSAVTLSKSAASRDKDERSANGGDRDEGVPNGPDDVAQSLHSLAAVDNPAPRVPDPTASRSTNARVKSWIREVFQGCIQLRR